MVHVGLTARRGYGKTRRGYGKTWRGYGKTRRRYGKTRRRYRRGRRKLSVVTNGVLEKVGGTILLPI